MADHTDNEFASLMIFILVIIGFITAIPVIISLLPILIPIAIIYILVAKPDWDEWKAALKEWKTKLLPFFGKWEQKLAPKIDNLKEEVTTSIDDVKLELNRKKDPEGYRIKKAIKKCQADRNRYYKEKQFIRNKLDELRQRFSELSSIHQLSNRNKQDAQRVLQLLELKLSILDEKILCAKEFEEKQMVRLKNYEFSREIDEAKSYLSKEDHADELYSQVAYLEAEKEMEELDDVFDDVYESGSFDDLLELKKEVIRLRQKLNSI